MKTMKILGDSRRSLGRDLNLGPPEYETRLSFVLCNIVDVSNAMKLTNANLPLEMLMYFMSQNVTFPPAAYL
jgi:hypothetical protein